MPILYLLIALALFAFLWNNKTKQEDFSPAEVGIVQEPPYLKKETSEDGSESYAYSVVNKQAKEIRNLRKRLKKMAEKLDDTGNMFYRRKLSNKYYRPRPFLSHAFNNSMNLYDDDFSTKTLSTIKFLSQTRSSKFHGDEIHFPSELCGHHCTTSDPNAQLHEQVDLVRPVTPIGYINRNK